MSALQDLSTFEVKIGGVSFRMRRRTTALMLLIGDPVRVFGLLAEGRKKGRDEADQEKDMTSYFKAMVEMEDNVCPVALVAIDGVEFVHDNQPWPELDPVKGLLLKKFISSGLEADPIESSCTAPAEQKQ